MTSLLRDVKHDVTSAGGLTVAGRLQVGKAATVRDRNDDSHILTALTSALNDDGHHTAPAGVVRPALTSSLTGTMTAPLILTLGLNLKPEL